jgi:hypothetical protein
MDAALHDEHDPILHLTDYQDTRVTFNRRRLKSRDVSVGNLNLVFELAGESAKARAQDDPEIWLELRE